MYLYINMNIIDIIIIIKNLYKFNLRNSGTKQTVNELRQIKRKEKIGRWMKGIAK